MNTEDRDIQRKRLRYRATHRGTKEADAIIGGYVTAEIDGLGDDQLDALESLLDQLDPDLMDWLQGRQPMPDEDFTAMLKLIKVYQQDLLTN